MPTSSSKFGINGSPSMLCNTPSAATKATRPQTAKATAAGFSSVSSHFSFNVPVISFNLSWTSSLLVVAFTFVVFFWSDTDGLNCLPTNDEDALLTKFEDRLALIERVAKTVLDAVIDCISFVLYIFPLWRVYLWRSRVEIDGSLPLSLSPSLLDSKKSHGRKRFDWFLQTSSLAFSFFLAGRAEQMGLPLLLFLLFFSLFFFLSFSSLSPRRRIDNNNNNLPIRA